MAGYIVAGTTCEGGAVGQAKAKEALAAIARLVRS